MKNIFTASLMMLFATTSLASILNCTGYKNQDFAHGKKLEDAGRDFPYVYAQMDDIAMHVVVTPAGGLTIIMNNSKNKLEHSRTTIESYAKMKDFTFVSELSTAAGDYKVICK